MLLLLSLLLVLLLLAFLVSMWSDASLCVVEFAVLNIKSKSLFFFVFASVCIHEMKRPFGDERRENFLFIYLARCLSSTYLLLPTFCSNI